MSELKAKRRILGGHADELSLVDSPANGQELLVVKRLRPREGSAMEKDTKDTAVQKDVAAPVDVAAVIPPASTIVPTSTDNSALIDAVTKNTAAISELISKIGTPASPAPSAPVVPPTPDVAVAKADAPPAISVEDAVSKAVAPILARLDSIESTRPAPTGASQSDGKESVEKGDKAPPFWGGRFLPHTAS